MTNFDDLNRGRKDLLMLSHIVNDAERFSRTFGETARGKHGSAWDVSGQIEK
jgi:hypothetical protein